MNASAGVVGVVRREERVRGFPERPGAPGCPVVFFECLDYRATERKPTQRVSRRFSKKYQRRSSSLSSTPELNFSMC